MTAVRTACTSRPVSLRPRPSTCEKVYSLPPCSHPLSLACAPRLCAASVCGGTKPGASLTARGRGIGAQAVPRSTDTGVYCSASSASDALSPALFSCASSCAKRAGHGTLTGSECARLTRALGASHSFCGAPAPSSPPRTASAPYAAPGMPTPTPGASSSAPSPSTGAGGSPATRPAPRSFSSSPPTLLPPSSKSMSMPSSMAPTRVSAAAPEAEHAPREAAGSPPERLAAASSRAPLRQASKAASACPGPGGSGWAGTSGASDTGDTFAPGRVGARGWQHSGVARAT
mmetsp:Transcript_2841/g.8602  ORF Transcript_2841/g.8602 Transcript_2841/m.8602 type:complete len:288 (+) Transcript_2841:304-1167(+)